MHDIECTIRDHVVVTTEVHGTPVSGTVDHWTLTADFDAEWDALAKRVTFSNGAANVTMEYSDGMAVPWEALDTPGTLRFSFVGVAPDGTEVVRTAHMRNGVAVKSRGADLGAPAQAATEDIVHAAQRNLADLATHVADAGEVVERAQQAVGDAGRAAESATSAAQSATTAAGQAASASASANTAAATATKAAADLRAAAERGDFDGQPGAPGVSPTATVSKSGRVTTVTVTDAHGTTTAEVLDGEPGSDYVLTPADKAEIAALVPVPPGGVQDVTLAGQSCVVDGVAEIPLAIYEDQGQYSIPRYDEQRGVFPSSLGYLTIAPATNPQIDDRVTYKPIVPLNVVHAVDSVLCSTAATERLTKAQQDACRARIGLGGNLVFIESFTTSERVSKITRSKESDGTPYRFKALAIKFGNVKRASGSTGYYFVTTKNENGTNRLLALPTMDGTARWQTVWGESWYGRTRSLFAQASGVGSNGSNPQVVSSTDSFLTCEYFTDLTVQAGGDSVFESGVTIEIYGARY